MNFDPQKFFIGLMDFFSILLPGALLTWLLMDEVGPAVLKERYDKLADRMCRLRVARREHPMTMVTLYFDKLIILDPASTSWATIGANHYTHEDSRKKGIAEWN